MVKRLLGSDGSGRGFRASRLSGLKKSVVYNNKLVTYILNNSPFMTHVLEDMYRTVHNRVLVPEAMKDAGNLAGRLDDIATRFPEQVGTSDAEPVFVFSAGWRSGSTLLQRVLMSSGEIMVWGEPYSRANLTGTLLNQFRSFTVDWPRDYFFADTFSAELSEEWVANIYPSVSVLIGTHRNFFINLFETPAHAYGRARWGFKEARLGTEHARYLKFLFPKARFIFLYRNPYSAYKSFRHYIKGDFVEWPSRPVVGARSFARVWRELVTDYAENAPALGGLLIAYEQFLKDPAIHEQVCDYVGARLKLPRELSVIPAHGQKDKSESWQPENDLYWWEKTILRRELGATATRFGYNGPPDGGSGRVPAASSARA
jgi:Sulfotransferase family